VSLEVCDRIAASIGRSVRSHFRDSFTSTSVEESSEKESGLWLFVGEPEGQKGSIWACAQIRCSRVEAGVWDLGVRVQATVINGAPFDQETLSVSDAVRKYRELDLLATTTTRYCAGRLDGEPDVVLESLTDFSFPVMDSRVTVDELGNEEIYENVGRSALERLVALREIYQQYESRCRGRSGT
jgi:hypothetical protein